jgi:hypothetical protein
MTNELKKPDLKTKSKGYILTPEPPNLSATRNPASKLLCFKLQKQNKFWPVQNFIPQIQYFKKYSDQNVLCLFFLVDQENKSGTFNLRMNS